MSSRLRLAATIVPVVSLLALGAVWERELPPVVELVIVLLLAGCVLAAVHHAEVVAHRVGEPFGSLILAVAVTVIEVGLIVTLMISGGPAATALARDTVFAAVMITCNGIVGLSLLLTALKRGTAPFNPEGTGAALATVITLATLSMVLPTFTTSNPGPEFSGPQLAFAAVVSISLYVLFVFVQSIRHRNYFLPEGDDDSHADVPPATMALTSLVLLLVALVAVVGLAKVESKTIEDAVTGAGLPGSVVGVVIALLVLLPETLAAARNARRNRVQISLNLALGSAMASIGLTIPTIAIASIWLTGPLTLGLGAVHITLLALTAVVGTLTVIPGRATLLQAGVHLALCGSYLFLAAVP
ncbi:calcium:proton antiporter [Herbidospora cretacea]|uniref:calcium:proton antiporter n=1 Tax=Herbidospora cretacea TaxID=28444 RepID=UPI0007732663|nr:ionic transporter y4hA [Herbidospora cretacea]